MKGRMMGLDVGDKRIGVAVSDPSGMIAQPHSTVNQRGDDGVKEIVRLVGELSVGTIVIGLPHELDGTVGEQANKVLSFVELLKKRLAADPAAREVATVLWDERLTSVEAERVLAGSRLKDRERRGAIDRIAAALILESYLLSAPRS